MPRVDAAAGQPELWRHPVCESPRRAQDIPTGPWSTQSHSAGRDTTPPALRCLIVDDQPAAPAQVVEGRPHVRPAPLTGVDDLVGYAPAATRVLLGTTGFGAAVVRARLVARGEVLPDRPEHLVGFRRLARIHGRPPLQSDI